MPRDPLKMRLICGGCGGAPVPLTRCIRSPCAGAHVRTPQWRKFCSAVLGALMSRKPTWKALLSASAPLQLPGAHDALTAKLIERAGFHAYQIGGFALVGARHALPDVDLARFAEQSAGVRDILAACHLPVLVDADHGYGDAKR